VARVEASTKMLRLVHESEKNHFKGIATGDEYWFEYYDPSSKMFPRSPTDGIPRTRHEIGTKQIMITIVFTQPKLIVLDILPTGSKFNQLYFVDYIFPDLKRKKTQNFIVGSRMRHSGYIWIIQYVTMDQEWYQNSRSLMFHDYHTIIFARHKSLRLLAFSNVKGSLEKSQVSLER
jgi:hypothetical protein